MPEGGKAAAVDTIELFPFCKHTHTHTCTVMQAIMPTHPTTERIFGHHQLPVYKQCCSWGVYGGRQIV